MATATGPNLAAAQRAVERLMDDTFTLGRNPGGVTDAVLDPTSGKLIEPTNQPGLYADIPCLVKHRGEGAGESLYEIDYPIANVAPMVGDLIEVISSRRDPSLVGMRAVVYEVVVGTFQVMHSVYVQRTDQPVYPEQQ